MHLEGARALADRLAATLAPYADRVEIAGSVRREKAEVKDVELVAISRFSLGVETDLFGEVLREIHNDLLADAVDALAGQADATGWEFDPGLRRNGPRYKRLRHAATGLCCDLFITTPAGWGGALAIRTGPSAFSQALVTLARRRGWHVGDGYLLHKHRRGVTDQRAVRRELPCPKGTDCPLIAPTLDEPAFFAALGVPWTLPRNRSGLVEQLEALLRTKV